MGVSLLLEVPRFKQPWIPKQQSNVFIFEKNICRNILHINLIIRIHLSPIGCDKRFIGLLEFIEWSTWIWFCELDFEKSVVAPQRKIFLCPNLLS